MWYRQLKQGQDKRASKKGIATWQYLFEVFFESHQMMIFKKLSSLYFKRLNVFFKQFIKETVCVFKKGFEYLRFKSYSMREVICFFQIFFDCFIK